jgi:hypothetical protein
MYHLELTPKSYESTFHDHLITTEMPKEEENPIKTDIRNEI